MGQGKGWAGRGRQGRGGVADWHGQGQQPFQLVFQSGQNCPPPYLMEDKLQGLDYRFMGALQ